MYRLRIINSQPVHFHPNLQKCTGWQLLIPSRYIFARYFEKCTGWELLNSSWYVFAQKCEKVPAGNELIIPSRYIFRRVSENVPACLDCIRGEVMAKRVSIHNLSPHTCALPCLAWPTQDKAWLAWHGMIWYGLLASHHSCRHFHGGFLQVGSKLRHQIGCTCVSWPQKWKYHHHHHHKHHQYHDQQHYQLRQ